MPNFLSVLGACVLSVLGTASFAQSQASVPIEVDLELIIAADRSGSISKAMRLGQRNGFVEAFRDHDLHRAITSGPLGKIAVLYVEWSDQTDQEVIIPWTVLSSIEDIQKFADALELANVSIRGGETSISGVMTFSHRAFDTNTITAYRKVVDISGNGRNSSGGPVGVALSLLRSAGVTVNGLVLPRTMYGDVGPYDMLFSTFDGQVDEYFRRTVMGGPGAFVAVVDEDDAFADAILRKLVLEVAWKGNHAILK